MFKKCVLGYLAALFAIVCLMPAAASCDDCCEDECVLDCNYCCSDIVLVEAKAAYFHPTNRKICKIYSNGMGMYGAEATYLGWSCLYPWVSVDYMSRKGHSLGEHDPTRVTVVPLGFGLKFLQDIGCTRFYLGAGALYSHIRMRDHSPFVFRAPSRWQWGGIWKIGLLVHPMDWFSIDLFTNYSYMKFDFHKRHEGEIRVIRHDVDFSGWSFGGSIGMTF